MLGASKLMLGSANSFGNSTITGSGIGSTPATVFANTVGTSSYITYQVPYTQLGSSGGFTSIPTYNRALGNLTISGNTTVLDVLVVGAGGYTDITSTQGGNGGQVRFYPNVIIPTGTYTLAVSGGLGGQGYSNISFGTFSITANDGSPGQTTGGTATGGSGAGGSQSSGVGGAGKNISNFGTDLTWIVSNGNPYFGGGGGGASSSADNVYYAGGITSGFTLYGALGQGNGGIREQGYSPTANPKQTGLQSLGGGAGGGRDSGNYPSNYSQYYGGSGVIIIRKINPPATYNVDYLAVAGGGSGGSRIGAGGGAGGLLTSSFTATQGRVYTVTIGAGGTAVTSTPGSVGNNGANTSINGTGLTTVTAIGGGYGGCYGGPYGGDNGDGIAGGTGGSGGGGSYSGNGGVLTAGSGTSAQGNAGGDGSATIVAGGGGGGAGAAGATPPSTGRGGDGGIGTQSSITGTATYYAGGGGGSSSQFTTVGAGGNGGGGAGSNSNNNATAGTANTGGGGGGARNDSDVTNVTSGAGGSGVVILSVPTANYSGVTTGSPTITTSGSNTIIKFTSSGTYTA